MENSEAMKIHHDMSREDKIKQELFSLRPSQNPVSNVVLSILLLASVAFIPVFFPQLENANMFIFLPGMFAVVFVAMNQESKKLHRRIDLLQKLYESNSNT